ncbi:MAG: hypothetical protein ABI568_00050 [Pseudarthrobacter sp.]
MSAINAYFEAVPLGPVSAPAAGQGEWPVHCATEMEMVVPAVGGTTVEYTFELEEGPVLLPPVWRCSCGFQLDAWATGWPELAEAPLTPGQRVPALTVRA